MQTSWPSLSMYVNTYTETSVSEAPRDICVFNCDSTGGLSVLIFTIAYFLPLPYHAAQNQNCSSLLDRVFHLPFFA